LYAEVAIAVALVAAEFASLARSYDSLTALGVAASSLESLRVLELNLTIPGILSEAPLIEIV
jgi:hypothetical protein